jgi:hypothetical protein
MSFFSRFGFGNVSLPFIGIGMAGTLVLGIAAAPASAQGLGLAGLALPLLQGVLGAGGAGIGSPYGSPYEMPVGLPVAELEDGVLPPSGLTPLPYAQAWQQQQQRCNTGRLIGGLVGGGIGYATSQGDGRSWAIPLGALIGSQLGCNASNGRVGFW